LAKEGRLQRRLARGLPKIELEDELRSLMEDHPHRQAAIAKGKLA
jgi:hypothetical protein